MTLPSILCDRTWGKSISLNVSLNFSKVQTVSIRKTLLVDFSTTDDESFRLVIAARDLQRFIDRIHDDTIWRDKTFLMCYNDVGTVRKRFEFGRNRIVIFFSP